MTKIIRIAESELQEMEQRKRAQLINSIGGYKSGILIGTVDKEGQENLAIFNSIFHLGANPPLFGLIFRPDSAPRHTLANIEDTGFFTVNHIHSKIIEQAHHTSARYDKSVSEFKAAGLTPEYLNDFFAPFVKEARVKFSAQLAEVHRLTINNTIMVIGKILEIQLPENAILEDGMIDLVATDTIAVSGLDRYMKAEEISRLPYAKPNPQYH